ncbi:hypothetical protein SAMN05421684_7878 [Asanoa ishikariensis]|uniref:Uncharacterized protein n=1 Tax=Asanoa ishikariensis TaxID=137265 RepID=A0A1H3USD0_9ACTN|nr:hypothetical protein SAMN05421684_7878 [Asanoa ishikariensis]
MSAASNVTFCPPKPSAVRSCIRSILSPWRVLDRPSKDLNNMKINERVARLAGSPRRLVRRPRQHPNWTLVASTLRLAVAPVFPGRRKRAGLSPGGPRSAAKPRDPIGIGGGHESSAIDSATRPGRCMARPAGRRRARGRRLLGRVRRLRLPTDTTRADPGDLSGPDVSRFSRVVAVSNASGQPGSGRPCLSVVAGRHRAHGSGEPHVYGSESFLLRKPSDLGTECPARTLTGGRAAHRADQVWLSLLIAGIHACSGLSGSTKWSQTGP